MSSISYFIINITIFKKKCVLHFAVQKTMLIKKVPVTQMVTFLELFPYSANYNGVPSL